MNEVTRHTTSESSPCEHLHWRDVMGPDDETSIGWECDDCGRFFPNEHLPDEQQLTSGSQS